MECCLDHFPGLALGSLCPAYSPCSHWLHREVYCKILLHWNSETASRVIDLVPTSSWLICKVLFNQIFMSPRTVQWKPQEVWGSHDKAVDCRYWRNVVHGCDVGSSDSAWLALCCTVALMVKDAQTEASWERWPQKNWWPYHWLFEFRSRVLSHGCHTEEWKGRSAEALFPLGCDRQWLVNAGRVAWITCCSQELGGKFLLQWTSK